MSKQSANRCAVCQQNLNNREEIERITSCGHYFHRGCLQKRQKAGKSQCPVCHVETKSTIIPDAKRSNIVKATIEKSSSTHVEKPSRKSGLVTSPVTADHISIDLTDENGTWVCHQCSAKNALSSKHCFACKQQQKANKTSHTAVNDAKKDSTRIGSVGSLSQESTLGKAEKSSNMQWECPSCSYLNEISVSKCATCNMINKEKSHRPSSASLEPITSRSGTSELETIEKKRSLMIEVHPDVIEPFLGTKKSILPRISSAKGDKTQNADLSLENLSTNNFEDSVMKTPTYIHNLVMDTDDEKTMERLISDRIKTSLNIVVGDVKYYSKLALAVVYVSNKLMRRLVYDICQLCLNPKRNTNITFVEHPDLIAYIVFDVTKEGIDSRLPNRESVSQRWNELYRNAKVHLCEQLSTQYPNIFRLATRSLEDMIKASDWGTFAMSDISGRIYTGADCSFLEGLPRKTTVEELRQSIMATISPPIPLSSSSIFIQMNKSANSACIISTDMARQWSSQTYIKFEDQLIPRKSELTIRLIIRSVSATVPVQQILNMQIFQNKVQSHQLKGDRLTIDLNDKEVFQHCLLQKQTSIGGQIFYFEPFSVVANPDECYIDDETWYDTEMQRNSADIMTFVSDPNHNIFRYCWNSQAWLDHFNQVSMKQENTLKANDPKRLTNDKIRHQLRVTVMLNTLGVIQKKFYMYQEEKIPLKLNSAMKTIVYDHRSKLIRSGSLPSAVTPCRTTTVSVTNEDCLIAYQRLANSGKSPLLLNMANASSPGGGYRKGDGAQEENLFRRSDYFRSLDVELDGKFASPSDRFFCSSTGQHDRIRTNSSKLYPINDFGAIYTSGLTVFRDTEDSGYAFMKTPLENVCSLALAAYRDPALEGNQLAPKYAIGMLKKIQNLFAIAHIHKHDCLILSAFGCGAFKNPPIHVAKLFREVIRQYAGFFEQIIFAIVDDHNTGHHLNPDGNFQPFRDILDNICAQADVHTRAPDTMVGPYRIQADGVSFTDVCIFDLVPCLHGANCTQINDMKHTREYSHPSLCTESLKNGKCSNLDDPVHAFAMIHRNQCRYGGECREIDNQKHAQQFEHPPYCSKGGECQNMEENHLRNFRHLPLCKDALKCIDFKKLNRKHIKEYRHCLAMCLYGNFCIEFHNSEHLAQYKHPFPDTCPWTPFECTLHTELAEKDYTKSMSNDVEQHCLDFGHVCRFGRACTDSTALHWIKSIHVIRFQCPLGDQCKRLTDEDHLNSFTHKNIPDIRRVCRYGNDCHERRKPEHIIQFRHRMSFEDSGIVRYCNLNKDVNFVQNQMENIARINNYIKSRGLPSITMDSIPHDILNWIRHVQPVHRCAPFIFESILLHGHVMSRDFMENLKKPKFVANSILRHSRIRRFQELRMKNYEDVARAYITGLVMNIFRTNNFPKEDTTGSGGIRPLSASVLGEMKRNETILGSVLKGNGLEILKKKTTEIAEASINLHTNPMGIGYERDQHLGTNKTVFSILGPHLGHYYGDIFIVFKRDILHHPDVNFTMQAATSFASGNAFSWRPWLGADPADEMKRIHFYHGTKLHAATPGYEYATALELIAMTSQHCKKPMNQIGLDRILERWLSVDSHQNIEAHLPQLIPIDYIDHIYMTKNILDSLSHEARRSLNAVFKYCMTITDHEIELLDKASGNFGPKPDSAKRTEYQKHVIECMNQHFNRHATTSPSKPLRGSVITIEASEFNDHIVTPITISQAHIQYMSIPSHSASHNTVYIYWQAMNGEMMLTVSSETINLDDTKQANLNCLICYIAEKANPGTSHYHENETYLNVGYPSQHAMFKLKKKFLTFSNKFHIGVNPDHFVTYCLKLDRSSGQVTLYHAGPNSLINHEKITCKCNKSDLDLGKLEYIHVSAGDKIIPIRNLMICFEPEADLHPSIDKDYKRPTTSTDATESRRPDSVAEKARPSIPISSSTLTPCRDNVNCLLQYEASALAASHNEKYSHPCRFSELCRKKETNLTHEVHDVPMCKEDRACKKQIDPYHRAQFRHTDLPDFLVPCRDQARCKDTSARHRIKYSHGEKVYKRLTSPSTYPEATKEVGIPKEPCKYGAQCYRKDPTHREKYSHP